MPDTPRPYSLKQALEFTELASQTMRHWREVLPPLQGRKAHGAGFSARDLLAILVVKTWVGEIGGQVRFLTQSADSLFALCSDEPWPKLEQSFLAYSLESKAWSLVGLEGKLVWDNGVILLPVYKLATRLREQLTGEVNSPQQALSFPLMSVSSDSHSNVNAKKRHKEMR